MNVQLESRIWIAAHGLDLFDVVENGTERTNDATWLEDLVGVCDGRLQPYSWSRSACNAPVVLELLDQAPSDDDIDGVVDAPLRLTSGLLRITGDGDTRISVAVDPGAYRVRVAYANNATSTYDDRDGADHMRLSMWPNALTPFVVRKPKADSDDERETKYSGTRSKKELLAYLNGPSISHRCLATVALAQQGELAPLVSAMANNPHDAVRLVYLSSLAFGSKKALKILEDERAGDNEELFRIVQSLRRIGGKPAKALCDRFVEDLDDANDDDVVSLIRDEVQSFEEDLGG